MWELEERQGHVLKILEWQSEVLGHLRPVVAHRDLCLLNQGQAPPSTACARIARAQPSPSQALQVRALPRPQLSFL